MSTKLLIVRKLFIFITVLAVTSVTNLHVQGLILSLLDPESTITKGTIDTEVLTGIIQQNQEELKKK